MIIADLHCLQAAPLAATSISGAGTGFLLLDQLAYSSAISAAGDNNIASPATALSLNLAPVTQATVL